MAEKKKTLPLIPLRNMVVFPSMILPLYVGRKQSLAALEWAANTNEKTILLTAQKDVEVVEPTPNDLQETGVLAKIVQLLRLPDGTIKVLVEGVDRIKLLNFTETSPFFKAEFETIKDITKITLKLEELIKKCIDKFEQYVKINKKIPNETLVSIINVDAPGRLSDLIISYLTLKVEEKQKLLESINVTERLSLLDQYLGRELGLMQVENKLHIKVQDQIEKVQKEYYLKEKLKAIQRELGKEGEALSEIEEYHSKIEAAGMPEDVKNKAIRELGRLEKLQAVSAEAGVIRAYLDWLIELPWIQEPKADLNIDNVKNILDHDHYGLEDVKERILEHMAVYQNTNKLQGTILLLVGPPGVGKTSIAQSIATAMKRDFYRITLGGMRDEAELRGHRRTYVGSMPGKIVQALSKVKSKDPVILLDEVDKLSKDYKGDPTAVLMEILDPVQNKNFVDSYLEVPFDLSNVFFIGTANTTFEISRPLLDRMEIIKLSGYTEDEKVEISKRYLIPKALEKHGISPKKIDWTNEGIRMIINEYTREAGLRELERSLSAICRKHVRACAQKQKTFKKISRHNMHHYLGIPKYQDRISKQNEVGLASGLAWTDSGGEVIQIEVSILKGKGELTLTGNMGDVMRESAKAALSFVRSRYSALGLNEDFYKTTDVHIHIPEGAIPKDGPSAGITIATALASTLAGLPVRGSVAMTGEITLRGRVMKIGGLKEKVLAAVRAGIEKIIVPYDNKPELQEFSSKIHKKIKFFPVKNMDEVLYCALMGYKAEKKHNIDAAILEHDFDNDRPSEELLS